jgi:hypothetical protein
MLNSISPKFSGNMAIIKFEFKTTLDFIVSDLTYIQLGFEVKVAVLKSLNVSNIAKNGFDM